MSIFDSVAAMFSGPARAPNAQTPNPDPQNLQTQQGNGTDNNGVVPKQPDPNASPLDKHKDVWKTSNTPNPADAPIFDGLDPQKVQEAVAKNDFSKVVPAEVWQKIKAGGDDAAVAFADAMNRVAQSSFASQTVVSTQLIEQALKKQREQFEKMLPTLVRKASASDALVTENPTFAHPAVQPIVEALQKSFVSKNPNASAAEINSQIKDVMTGLATAFAPKSADADSGKPKKGETDWSKFLEGDPSSLFR